MCLDDIKKTLLEAEKNADIEVYRNDLIASLDIGSQTNIEDRDFNFVCEVSSRLLDAEEFQDFIPCHYSGTGQRGKKVRVDGYEVDEIDDSIRLLISDFNPQNKLETLTKTKAESIFSQLKAFVDESVSGRMWSNATSSLDQVHELTGILENYHGVKDGNRKISRYKLYLISDSNISQQLKELPTEYIDGIPVEFHIWDISRLKAVASSKIGTEELEINFSDYLDEGIPTLRAGHTEDYEGFLCVIPGKLIADLYGDYGSKLLEGNVRSYLSSNAKVNKGIQSTIRKEPGRFFVYNNGISATASAADVVDSPSGSRLLSVKHLQIVNGGQTTASLHAAKTKDKNNLDGIYVQMKLSVVKAKESDTLDKIIQSIARYSNTQTKVDPADFFSNHPFHVAIEKKSRQIHAPASEGAQFHTFWFYERARGQFNNAQSQMTVSEKRNWLRANPKSQYFTKTDLAKFENSWRKLPHIVSRGAQKNFTSFADYVEKEYGENGYKFDNDVYYKAVIAKAIIFKYIEKMVSQAKSTWYGGDYRAQIVTYTISKMVSMIESLGLAVNLSYIWTKQSVSTAMAEQLEVIARVVSDAVTSPPIANMNVGEWCKKEECWTKLDRIDISLNEIFREELLEPQYVDNGVNEGRLDSSINDVIEAVTISQSGGWSELQKWASKFHPIYGKEADLVRNAIKHNFVPTPPQAKVLMRVLKEMESSGFFFSSK